jgi:hypothetical protein
MTLKRLALLNMCLTLGAAIAAEAAGRQSKFASCAPEDPRAVIARVENMFLSLSNVNDDSVVEVFTEDFYAFDAGRRFDGGRALVGTIRYAQRSGRDFTWSVTQPEVHMACRIAWITYVNKGSVSTSGISQPVTWLESALLRYEKDRWAIAFLHSTRATQN